MLKKRRPKKTKRTDTRVPYTTLLRAYCPAIRSWPWPVKSAIPPCSITCATSIGLTIPCRCTTWPGYNRWGNARSEEHTSELQSLMRLSYAVFCLIKHIPFLLISHHYFSLLLLLLLSFHFFLFIF